jgi:hypothetical protein
VEDVGSSALAVGWGGAVSAGAEDMRVLRMLCSLFIRSLGASALASLFRLEMDEGCRGMLELDFSAMPGTPPCALAATLAKFLCTCSWQSIRQGEFACRATSARAHTHVHVDPPHPGCLCNAR